MECIRRLLQQALWNTWRPMVTRDVSTVSEDKLSVRLQHVGMTEGRMRIKVSAYKEETDEIVLEAEAQVEQAKTAYIFTGQGSQSKGMGIDLYISSPVAKAVWDDVDAYLSETYGMFRSESFMNSLTNVRPS